MTDFTPPRTFPEKVRDSFLSIGTGFNLLLKNYPGYLTSSFKALIKNIAGIFIFYLIFVVLLLIIIMVFHPLSNITYLLFPQPDKFPLSKVTSVKAPPLFQDLPDSLKCPAVEPVSAALPDSGSDEIPGVTGTICIATNPPFAYIHSNGEEIGKANIKPITLPVGEQELEFFGEGYSHKVTVNIKPGINEPLEITLRFGFPALPAIILTGLLCFVLLAPLMWFLKAVCYSASGEDWEIADIFKSMTVGRNFLFGLSISYSYIAIFFLVSILLIIGFNIALSNLSVMITIFFAILVFYFSTKWSMIFPIMAYEDTYLNEALAKSGEIAKTGWIVSAFSFFIMLCFIAGSGMWAHRISANAVASESSYMVNYMMRVLIMFPFTAYFLLVYCRNYHKLKENIKILVV
jgi:hypothetical protein